MELLVACNRLRKKKRERQCLEVENAIIISKILYAKVDVRARSASIFRKRWDSEYLRNLAERERSFIAECRLAPRQFDTLHEMISPILQKNGEMAKRAMSKCKSNQITTESRLGAALIMLAGGRAMEAMRTHGLAKTTVYKNLHEVVRAINIHPALEIKYDSSISALKSRANGFRQRGQFELFEYMTDSADGLLIRLEAPARFNKSVAILNKTQYYSGSKKSFGINMQGVCDSNIKFTAVSCKHVGSTNDALAFETSNLKEINSNLPFPYHWCGDPAYTLTNTMMIPYEGVNIHITFPSKESFNFYHSQLRITIERCFGVFIGRWGIFWKDLKYDVEFIMDIVHACCRLHNFCIDSQLPTIYGHYNLPPVAQLDERGVLVDDVWRNVDPEEIIAPTVEERNDVGNGNVLRDEILRVIEENGYEGIRSHHL